MNDKTSSRPAILIDTKKHRIRIHKYTLHSIGDPDNILLLINPEERTMVIMACDRSEPRAHHILWESVKNKKSIELYSTTLVESLCTVCREWKNNSSYRIYGELIPNEGVARFQLSDSVLMSRAQ